MSEINLERSEYAKKAMDLFREGYNCAQAVFLAFEDKYDMSHELALKMSSSFGGGIGRMREVCGAVSGMCMVAGAIYGYDSPTDNEAKKEHYKRIQELADVFREQNGSIVCRELLGLTQKGSDNPEPEKRTDEYYKKRPCAELVGMAATIMENYIKGNE